jgi:photosystem II stability/assembly factor-like uncharacterized protein
VQLALRRAPGILFVLLVVAAVGFTFSQRPAPRMPATEVRIEHLLILDAQRIGSRIVAVGERGHMFISDDDGDHWRRAGNPFETTLTALAAVDDRVLVAVGHDARILRSADRGEAWTEVFSAPDDEEPLLAVQFDASGRGFALGAYGRLMTSDDAGRTWTRNDLDADELHLNAMAAIGPDRFITGEAGTLLRSEDGGTSWYALDAPYEGSFFGALATADGALLLYGMRGHVFRSQDRGVTWAEIASDTQASLFGGRMMSDGRIFLLGQNGTVRVSTDHGQTLQQLTAPSSDLWTTLLATETPGRYLLFGERGVREWIVERTMTRASTGSP